LYLLKYFQVKSPHLEGFLKQLNKSSTASRQVMENLWRLYEKEGNFADAADVLVKMAERHGSDVGLDDRILYYGRALSCLKARVVPSDRSETADKIKEIGDKLDVARLQRKVR
jgi:nuclear pore complex protein Nup155